MRYIINLHVTINKQLDDMNSAFTTFQLDVIMIIAL